MKKIPLTQDKATLVDDEDFVPLMRRNWFAVKNGRTFYAGTKSNGRLLFLHVLLMGKGFDHWNGDGLDNQRANLRRATGSQNQGNARKRLDNTSGYKGVTQHGPKWQARVAGTYLGLFPSPHAAAHAYDVAAREKFGAFALCNFPI